MKSLKLIGKTFGTLAVIGEKRGIKDRRVWVCFCQSCGGKVFRTTSNLKKAVSCGCKKLSNGGISHSPTGVSWQAMMTRCYNKKQLGYTGYGARGIRVCEFIRASPVNLIFSIGMRPKGKTIDRIDNDGNYSCGQCAECLEKEWPKNIRWATIKQQNRNQSDLHYLTISGATKCASEWAENSNLSVRTILSRCRYGWSGEDLIKPPCR